LSDVNTKIWRVDAAAAGDEWRDRLREAAACLRVGGLVAFPTETVYGLGADARDSRAVERIFLAKGRPQDNPLIVHAATVEDALALASSVGGAERRLAERFWPGPLTIVLPVRPGAVSPLVTAGLDTVAVRVPGHAVARELIALAGVPVAAPSANRSGRPSPTSAAHVLEDLAGRIDGIVDGGSAEVGLESTVAAVDRQGRVRILRPGGVTAEDLEAAGFQVAAEEESFSENDPASAPRSPGVKYRHYAPRGELTVVEGAPDAVRAYIAARLAEDAASGVRAAVLAFAPEREAAAAYAGAALVLSLAESRRAPAAAAKRLYAALRECDAAGIGKLYAESAPGGGGIGRALANRLHKAAEGRVVRV